MNLFNKRIDRVSDDSHMRPKLEQENMEVISLIHLSNLMFDTYICMVYRDALR